MNDKSDCNLVELVELRDNIGLLVCTVLQNHLFCSQHIMMMCISMHVCVRNFKGSFYTSVFARVRNGDGVFQPSDVDVLSE